MLWLYGLRDWHGASALGGFDIREDLVAQWVVMSRRVMIGWKEGLRSCVRVAEALGKASMVFIGSIESIA